MSTDPPIVELPALSAEPEGGIDLFMVFAALLAEWRLAVATTMLLTLLCALYIFTLKPEFVAEATFVPQDTRDSNSIASLFSSHGPGALYIGLLESRSVQQDVIDRLNLMPIMKTGSAEAAIQSLNAKTRVEEAPTTIVTISVRDANAQLAARIANGYLDSLQNVIDSMSLQPSSQTTQFFERQLSAERDQLSAAEDVLAQVQRQTGLVSEAQTQSGLGAIAGIDAQVTDLNAQLSALLQSETDKNPQVIRLRSQIAALRAKQSSLEGGGPNAMGAAPAAGNIPQRTLDVERAQREVHYHEERVKGLAAQFETAKLNQTFARPAFEIVDRAVVPERKAWPPRRPYLMFGFAFSAFAGLVSVICKLLWRRLISDPIHRAKLDELGQALRRRRD